MGRALARKPHQEGLIRLIQFSDTHLYAKPEGELLGFNTYDGFKAVIDDIVENRQVPSLYVASGDIAQQEVPASYHLFGREVERLQAPCAWIPGNHDDVPMMLPILQEYGLVADKHFLLGKWQIILLDSQVIGDTFGCLADFQLRFLEHALAGYPHHHTLIFLHHQVVPVGSEWLDNIGLRNADQFLALMERFPKVKAVVCGHVHQDSKIEHQGIQYMSVPSTCIQFKTQSSGFAVEGLPPGYRELLLDAEGNVESTVYRIEDFPVSFDMTAKGY